MVSFTTLVLSAVAAVALSAQAALLKDTSKSSADLEQRDNRYKLKCGNAPSVVAGEYVHHFVFPRQPPLTPFTEAWNTQLT
jgi:hypothetical protein